jgi:hypothetical protein
MVYQTAATALSNSQYVFSASSPILEAANIHSATSASSTASYATNSLPEMHTRPSQCRWTSTSAMQQLALHAPAASKKFGEMEGGPTTETDGNTSTSNNKVTAAHANPDTIMLDIHEIMEDLIEAVNNKDAEDDPLPTIPNPLPAPGSCLASQRYIPLSELFIYPEAGAANPLAFYWKEGLQNNNSYGFGP